MSGQLRDDFVPGRGFLKQVIRELPRASRPSGPRPFKWGVGLHSEEIITLYLGGATLEAIGDQFDVSRERIRQILHRFGVNSGHKQLLQAASAATRKTKRETEREATAWRKYGMSATALDALSPYRRSHSKHPLFVWRMWVRNAKNTGLRFDLKFADWWRAWEQSGKWEERGRGHGYWMARWDRNKGWTKDNLRVVSGAERASDSYLQVSASERAEKARQTRESKHAASL